MARLEGIAPIVAVRDVATSLPFYTEVLGFDLRTAGEQYALVARDEAAVVLTGGADAAALEATANNVSAYVWVEDLAALWTSLEPALAALPEGRVRPPFDQPYGMREFHVKDPDGFLLLFGEEIA